MTTIAAIRYHDEVAVAADSALHDPNLGIIGSVCKLLAYGQYFIGVSGAYAGNNAEVSFDLFFELSRICDSSASSGQLADRIVAELTPTYEVLLRSMAKLDTEIYQRAYRDDPTIFAFLLAGFEAGLPFIRGRQFKLAPLATNQWNIDVDRVDYVGPPAIKEVNLLVLGSNKGFYEFVSARPSFWKLSAVEAARFAVAFEIADVPDMVRPPIDVLSLTKESHTWVQRKSGCQDSAEFRQPKR